MGRSPGSPNVNENHWHFVIYDPTLDPNNRVSIWERKYTTIADMHKDLQYSFTIDQLRSYARRVRKGPKNIEIKRICEPRQTQSEQQAPPGVTVIPELSATTVPD